MKVVRREFIIYGGLLLVTWMAFEPVLRCGFVNYDDPLYVTDNPHVRAGLTLAGLRYAWTTFDVGNWIPLTWMSLELDATLFGTRPTGNPDPD